ncbi:MAG: NAD(P)/FAD-dependent oxidoreductase, partial [Candidatus Angelobacter sp.]
PWVLQALQIDAADYAPSRTMQEIRGFHVSSIGAQEIGIPYEEVISYGIRRCEFDEYLLRRSGAEICEGVPISKIERSAGFWTVNGEIRTKILVGAGGHFCPVARHLGNTNSDEPVIAQEIEFEMSPNQAGLCTIQPEIPELYFCRDFQGYGWCFRKGNFLNIGLGRLDQHALSQHIVHFLDFLRATGKVAFDLPGKFAGHAYLLFGYGKRKVVGNSVMLIGDAAGLAFPQSGEGIRPAVESGLLAAKAIQTAEGRYGTETMQAYSDLLKKQFGDGSGSLPAAAFLPQWLRNSVAKFLFKKEWFCRRVVIESWFLR